MNSKIKPWFDRCDIEKGIVSSRIAMEKMKEEIEDLRAALSKHDCKPLTDEEITALVLEWWCPTMVTAKDRKFVRAIERAHGIGGGE